MAVRREVVSLSQLLQRRDLVRREPQSWGQSSGQGLVTAATVASSSCESTTHVSSNRDRSSSGCCTGQTCGRQTQNSRLPHHERGSAAYSYQSMLQPQSSQTDSCTLRAHSQSQDVPTQEDAYSGVGYATSQSQSQTYSSQPPTQVQIPLAVSVGQDDRVHTLSHQRIQHTPFSKILLESGKLSLEAAKERARGEEELLGKVIAPLSDMMKELKELIVRQLGQQSQHTPTMSRIDERLSIVIKLIETLREGERHTEEKCDECHKKIEQEVTSAREVFENMSLRMLSMEKNVNAFIENMTIFVREELFALHLHRDHPEVTQSGKTRDYESNQKRDDELRQKRNVHALRRNQEVPLSCSTIPSRLLSSEAMSDSVKSYSKSACRRSQRIRAKKEKVRGPDGSDDGDSDDKYGIRQALALVEEARAKRLRLL